MTLRRFHCPRCDAALTPWLRELTLADALCTQESGTWLMPAGFFARRGTALLDAWPTAPFAAFPWLLAPQDERWIKPHPDMNRTIGCCGLSFRGEEFPNLVCPCGHEVGVGYRDCCGPHWYRLHESVVTRDSEDARPLRDLDARLARARQVVTSARPEREVFTSSATDAYAGDPSTWSGAPWLDDPSLTCTGGEPETTLVIEADGMPDGKAAFLPVPWPVIVRFVALEESPWGSPDVPLVWKRADGPEVHIARADDVVLCTAWTRRAEDNVAMVFDAAEWSAAWDRLRASHVSAR